MKRAFIAVFLVAGCAPSAPFATVALLVREPQLKQPRLETDFVNLFAKLDGDERTTSKSFDRGVPPELPPIELGHAHRTLTASITTGLNPKDPSAVGRANALHLPSVDDPGIGDQVSVTAPVLLAHPNASEPLDTKLPTGRSGSAACDDKAGRAWIVGGVDGNNTAQNGYTFKLDSLKANVAFVLPFDNTGVACDGDEQGGVVALGKQQNETNSTLVFDASGVASGPDPIALGKPYDDPFVQVETLRASAVAWIASDAQIQLRDVIDPEHPRIALADVAAPEPQTRFLALDTQHLLRFASQKTELYTVHAAELDPQDVTSTLSPGDVVAIDVDDHALLVRGAGGLNLVEPSAIDETHIALDVVRSNLALPSQPGLSSGELALLSDGRAAVFNRDPVTATASVAIEGVTTLASLSTTNREHMAITVGGALLLFGGDDGHDVLVAPDAPDAPAP